MISLLSATGSIDFTGVKVGDVNQNAAPNHFIKSTVRNSTSHLKINIRNQTFQKGEEVEASFTAKEWKAILGYQFTLKFDESRIDYQSADFLNSTITLTEDHLNIKEEEGIINVAWNQLESVDADGEALFTMRFIAKTDGTLEEVLTINSAATATEAIDAQGNVMDVQLEFMNNFSSLYVAQNFPNPFREMTRFEYSLPQASEVTISVFDPSGRLLKSETLPSQPAGTYFYDFRQMDFPNTSGTLYYQVEAVGEKIIKSMVLVN